MAKLIHEPYTDNELLQEWLAELTPSHFFSDWDPSDSRDYYIYPDEENDRYLITYLLTKLSGGHRTFIVGIAYSEAELYSLMEERGAREVE